MTTEELVTFPDDGIDRWLVRGRLRTRQWRYRTPAESSAITQTAIALSYWTQATTGERGVVMIDAYHRLDRDPDTTLGIDLSLITQEQRNASRRQPFVDGVPILAVEILSPSDVHSDVSEKIQEYLDVGVKLVWIVDPDFETVAAYTQNEEPRLFNRDQELIAEPHLPAFRVRVVELFE